MEFYWELGPIRYLKLCAPLLPSDKHGKFFPSQPSDPRNFLFISIPSEKIYEEIEALKPKPQLHVTVKGSSRSLPDCPKC